MDHALKQQVWLSEAHIWQRLSDFYQENGAQAWVNRVPYQVTSNPKVASAYCEMILAFLEDWQLQNGPISDPLTIVELGAGHGGLANLMLSALAERADDFAQLAVSYRYLITDLVPANVEAWSVNPALQGWLDSPNVESLRYDCMSGSELTFSGKKISLADSPIVFIANYLFDSLPNEVFQLKEGEFLRGAVKLGGQIPQQEGTDEGPECLELALSFYPFDSNELAVSVRGLLEEYRQMGQVDCVSLPVGSLTCIEKLRTLSHDRLLLLSSDKAYSTQASVSQRTVQEVGDFASFSMVVNFHAIMLYFQHEGGAAWMQETQQEFLSSAAWSLGCDPGRMRHTRRAFRIHLNQASPGDLYSLSVPLINQRFEMSLGNLISLLKLLNWDAALFDTLYDAIFHKLSGARSSDVTDLLAALPQVANHRSCLKAGSDTLFNIAHLLQNMRREPSALELYLARIEEQGETSEIQYNMGLCHLAMGQADQAKQAFERALELNPEFVLAAGWLYQLSKGAVALGAPQQLGTNPSTPASTHALRT